MDTGFRFIWTAVSISYRHLFPRFRPLFPLNLDTGFVVHLYASIQFILTPTSDLFERHLTLYLDTERPFIWTLESKTFGFRRPVYLDAVFQTFGYRHPILFDDGFQIIWMLASKCFGRLFSKCVWHGYQRPKHLPRMSPTPGRPSSGALAESSIGCVQASKWNFAHVLILQPHLWNKNHSNIYSTKNIKVTELFFH